MTKAMDQGGRPGDAERGQDARATARGRQPAESAARAEGSTLYSIGYGTRTMDEFVALLDAHAIDFVVDVRSQPYSRFRPEFTKAALQEALEALGLHYVWMGAQLGGIPEDESLRDAAGRTDYGALQATPAFRAGIERMRTAHAKGVRLALMCAELRPESCHRARLIGRALAREGIPLRHIDEAGRVITQAEVEERLTRGQQDLFAAVEEVEEEAGEREAKDDS